MELYFSKKWVPIGSLSRSLGVPNSFGVSGLGSSPDMEMIDIWLILCQLVPFVEVVLFTAKEYRREKKDTEERNQGGTKLGNLQNMDGPSSEISFSKHVTAEVMFPMLVVFIVAAYFGLATFYYLQ